MRAATMGQPGSPAARTAGPSGFAAQWAAVGSGPSCSHSGLASPWLIQAGLCCPPACGDGGVGGCGRCGRSADPQPQLAATFTEPWGQGGQSLLCPGHCVSMFLLLLGGIPNLGGLGRYLPALQTQRERDRGVENLGVLCFCNSCLTRSAGGRVNSRPDGLRDTRQDTQQVTQADHSAGRRSLVLGKTCLPIAHPFVFFESCLLQALQ